MDGQLNGGHPFRQSALSAKGNLGSGGSIPTNIPTGARSDGLRPGELAWIAYTSMFGGKSGDWDDLDISDRARWSCVEAGILKHAPAPSAPTEGA